MTQDSLTYGKNIQRMLFVFSLLVFVSNYNNVKEILVVVLPAKFSFNERSKSYGEWEYFWPIISRLAGSTYQNVDPLLEDNYSIITLTWSDIKVTLGIEKGSHRTATKHMAYQSIISPMAYIIPNIIHGRRPMISNYLQNCLIKEKVRAKWIIYLSITIV